MKKSDPSGLPIGKSQDRHRSRNADNIFSASIEIGSAFAAIAATTTTAPSSSCSY